MDKLCLNAKQKEKKRQADLKVWMLRNDMPIKTIAETLGVTQVYVGQLLHGKRTTKKRRAELQEIIGVPARLLPPLRARARGNPSESGE